jgi:hypothetical protein
VAHAHERDWSFFHWAGAGFLIVFGLLAILTIGAPFLLLGVFVFGALVGRGPRWPSSLGLVAGAGAVCLVIGTISAISGDVTPTVWFGVGVALTSSACWAFWFLRCRPASE